MWDQSLLHLLMQGSELGLAQSGRAEPPASHTTLSSGTEHSNIHVTRLAALATQLQHMSMSTPKCSAIYAMQDQLCS